MSRIALIHALEESIKPARAAFAELWPEAHIFDLLDTSLATDLAHRGELDGAMTERFQALAAYAGGTAGQGGQTDGILFTCSAFGPAIDAVKARLSIPVLRPNEAAFGAALRQGRRLGLIVTFGPSLAALERELCEMAARAGQAITVVTSLAEGALAALKRGDGAEHDRIAAATTATMRDVDVVILGQFSLARAKAAVAEACGRPVVTTPHSAVEELRRRIENRSSSRA